MLVGKSAVDIFVSAVPEELFHESSLSTSTFLIAFDSASLPASEDYLLFSVVPLGASGPVRCVVSFGLSGISACR